MKFICTINSFSKFGVLVRALSLVTLASPHKNLSVLCAEIDTALDWSAVENGSPRSF